MQAQGHPGVGWHQHEGQAGEDLHLEWGALVTPGAEGSSPSWWEPTKTVSQVQAGQGSRYGPIGLKDLRIENLGAPLGVGRTKSKFTDSGH